MVFATLLLGCESPESALGPSMLAAEVVEFHAFPTFSEAEYVLRIEDIRPLPTLALTKKPRAKGRRAEVERVSVTPQMREQFLRLVSQLLEEDEPGHCLDGTQSWVTVTQGGRSSSHTAQDCIRDAPAAILAAARPLFSERLLPNRGWSQLAD